jgi:hypothetical protein
MAENLTRQRDWLVPPGMQRLPIFGLDELTEQQGPGDAADTGAHGVEERDHQRPCLEWEDLDHRPAPDRAGARRTLKPMTGATEGWLRSSAAKALVLAALVMSLVLGIGFVVINSRGGEMRTLSDAAPMTDEQATTQVIDSARQIVAAARLHGVNGSSIFLSCTSLHDPPYQAAVYLNFPLPEKSSVKHIRQVATAMVASGWQEAPAMGEHFGMKLTKGGVTSTFHENPDDARFATMRIYGECRNASDHHNDNPAFTDITSRLR